MRRGHAHGRGPHHGRPHRWQWQYGGKRIWRVRAELRGRIFMWFGAAIIAAAAVSGSILEVSGGHSRIAALVAGCAILWTSAGAISWRLTRPLAELVRVTGELGAGKLDARLELGGGRHRGDFGLLADAINDMAARIERSIADQRELLAAVSHELRTPLGHARILLESARERGGDAALVDGLEREVLEIDALVGQLLASSRLDFGRVERRDVDGAEAAALALERAGLAADRLEAAADAADGVRLRADPTLLARALANILANATEHGGGAVRLRVRREGAAVAFEVEDGGPGFSADELPHVFERFYRGERKAGGSLGLGLSLVRRIAEAHGGRAWAQNLLGGGAQVGFTIAPEPDAAATAEARPG